MSELKAGPELDAAVDAQVFEKSIVWARDMPWRLSPAADPGEWLVPRYSTDIQAAMRVVDKMREKDWLVMMRDDPPCVVTFFIYGRHDAYTALGSSLSEAVCLAALEAVESLEVKNELR